MSVRNALVLLFAVSALSFLVACGGYSSPKVVPPPSGAFSNSSLSGTYVFSSSGTDSSGFFLTIVGAFTASGGGTITGGAIDVASMDPAIGVSTNNAITSSTYKITPDGRGTATLNTALGAIGLDLVLQSNSHGLVTEFDNNGTGSGTIDLQASTIAQTALGALSFGLSGAGSSSASATVGAISLDPLGNVTAGAEDSNNGGTPAINQPILTSSFVTVGTGATPGTAQLATSTATYAFDVYAVDSTHLKLIETDGLLIVSGDAFTQGTSLPSGTLAYTMAGIDTVGNPLAVGGFMPTNSSGVITAGLEDYNDVGNVNQTTSVGGTFSALNGGRSVLSLTGFVNGAANDVPGSYTFAAYPFTSNGLAGLLLLEIDSGIANAITSGIAYTQTGTSFAASQGYGLNLSAINLNVGGTFFFEEDDIAEFTATSSGFTGIVDLNDEGTLTFDKSLIGAYAVDGTGRGTATTNYFNYTFYVVDGSTVLLLETDSNQIGVGSFQLQGGPASPAAVPAGASLFRPAVQAHAALRRK